jgi:hypothetical protein
MPSRTLYPQVVGPFFLIFVHSVFFGVDTVPSLCPRVAIVRLGRDAAALTRSVVRI